MGRWAVGPMRLLVGPVSKGGKWEVSEGGLTAREAAYSECRARGGWLAERLVTWDTLVTWSRNK